MRFYYANLLLFTIFHCKGTFAVVVVACVISYWMYSVQEGLFFDFCVLFFYPHTLMTGEQRLPLRQL